MRLSAPVAVVAALAAALFPATPALAAESFDGCKYTVTTLPVVLSTQGVWCLKGDLSTALATGVAVTVADNNITIDCNGYKLGGLAAGPATQTTGIEIDSRNTTTIRGCNIRGFRIGINADGAAGTVIEDNVFEGNTYIGIDATAGNSATVIRRNRLFDTGGADAPTAMAIHTDLDAHIIDNVIAGVTGDGVGNTTVYGISLNYSSGTVTGNRIGGFDPDGTGVARGIWNNTPGRVVIDGNFINAGGLTNAYGIRCDDDLGLARNNVIVGVTTGVLNCTSVGNHVGTD